MVYRGEGFGSRLGGGSDDPPVIFVRVPVGLSRKNVGEHNFQNLGKRSLHPALNLQA